MSSYRNLRNDSRENEMRFRMTYEPITVIALGHPGDPDQLPDKLRQPKLAARTRKPIGEFVFSGRWGQKSKLA